MFDSLLILLEQRAQVPAVTGGGPLLTYRKREPALEFGFRKGFLITGTIKPVLPPFHPILARFPIRGQITQTLHVTTHILGLITQPKMTRLRIRGGISPRLTDTEHSKLRSMQLRFQTHGEINKNISDIQRDLEDLKYLVEKKRRRYALR